MFAGTIATGGMKAFGIENLFANYWKRCNGAMYTASGFMYKLGYGTWKFNYKKKKKILKYCSDYVKPVVSRDSHKMDQVVKDVLKQSDNKSHNSILDDGFIVSYDVSDRDKYELKHNFCMALQRRGLVSLDF